jgi:ribosome-binding protein aMBF1 (putative translation factor)
MTIEEKKWTKAEQARGLLVRIPEGGYLQSTTGLVRVERAAEDETTDTGETADYRWKAGERQASKVTLDTAIKRMTQYKPAWLDACVIVGAESEKEKIMQNEVKERNEARETFALPPLVLMTPDEWAMDDPALPRIRRAASANPERKRRSATRQANGSATSKPKAERFNLVNMREIRKERGLSTKAVAEAIQRNASTVSEYERGVHRPTIEIVDRIAEVLGVNPAALTKPREASAERAFVTSPRTVRSTSFARSATFARK